MGMVKISFKPRSKTYFSVTVHSVHSNTLRDAQKSCIRMISRRTSRVFCELRSQKTPRGMSPVNSNSQSYHPPHLFCPGTFLLLQCKQALYYIFFLKLVVIFQDIVIAQKLSVIVRKILRSIPVTLLITHCTNTNDRQLFLQFHKELIIKRKGNSCLKQHITSQIIGTEIFLHCLRRIICPDHIGSCIGLLLSTSPSSACCRLKVSP